MIAISLAVFAVLYVIGVSRLWRRAGIGKGVRTGEAAAGAFGVGALALALGPPLHEWSESLFAAHMAQHELIMVVAAPLLAAGAPFIAMAWALPEPLRGRPLTAVRHLGELRGLSLLLVPGVAFWIHAGVLWFWHVPSLFERALASHALHLAQHLSFFVTALLFWWSVLRGEYGRAGYGAGVLYVFGTAMQSGLLGVLLLFSQRVWYSSPRSLAQWGLTPIEDQQLAGLIMWIPASVVFTGAGLFFLALWLHASQRRAMHGLTVGGSSASQAGTRRASGPIERDR